MNCPKLALLAGVVPLQWLALGFGARFGASGIPFTHFCLDAKIWHVREDKALAAALHMG